MAKTNGNLTKKMKLFEIGILGSREMSETQYSSLMRTLIMTMKLSGFGVADSMRISGCSIQKQSRTIITEKGSGSERERTDSASVSGSGSGTESGSAGRGSVSESGSVSATRSGSGGRRSGSVSEPSGTRRTGSTVTATGRRSGRRRRGNPSPAPHSHQAAKLSHQRRRPPLRGRR